MDLKSKVSLIFDYTAISCLMYTETSE